MAKRREFQQSPILQGVNERVAYTLTTTPWGSSPTSVVVKIYNPKNEDKSSTNLTGTVSVVGDVITAPLVISLLCDVQYMLTILFVCSGNTFEAFGYIIGE